MIYVIIRGEYSDWSIIGYFTNREEADKYCVAHRSCDYYVIPVSDLTNTEDLSRITLKYTHDVVIDRKPEGWIVRHEPDRYKCYMSDYLKSNEAYSMNPPMWGAYKINLDTSNREKAEKIALDYHYQLLAMGEGRILQHNIQAMNAKFKEPELAREKLLEAKRLQEQELAELARLKAKYES